MSFAAAIQKVDRRDPTPRYVQAREILIDAIKSGRLAPGAKLPSTKEVSVIFDVSLITAHRALESLVESGWLRREVGRGTFVREDVDFTQSTVPAVSLGLLLAEHPRVNLDDYYHSSILGGLQRQASRDARRVEFFFHDGFVLRDRGRRRVAAICIHPPIEQQARVEELARRFPTVVLSGVFPDSRVACVDCDNEGGSREAVRHLLELGHRRFMLLSGPLSLTNSRDRMNAARAELLEHGVTVNPRDVIVSTDSVVVDDGARARIETRLADPSRPTALVAGGFYLAMAAMQCARRARREIPADLSVVGFDDPQSAPLLDPPLTTVRQPLAELAAAAYQLACEGAHDRAIPATIVRMPTSLVVRASTARP